MVDTLPNQGITTYHSSNGLIACFSRCKLRCVSSRVFPAVRLIACFSRCKLRCVRRPYHRECGLVSSNSQHPPKQVITNNTTNTIPRLQPCIHNQQIAFPQCVISSRVFSPQCISSRVLFVLLRPIACFPHGTSHQVFFPLRTAVSLIAVHLVFLPLQIAVRLIACFNRGASHRVFFYDPSHRVLFPCGHFATCYGTHT